MLGLLSVVTDNCMVHIFKVSRSLEIQILLVFKSRKALFNSINPFSNNQQKLLVEPPQLEDLSRWALLHLTSFFSEASKESSRYVKLDSSSP